MKDVFYRLKTALCGKWAGEGFAKFPTIDDTHYTESLEFIPDEYKESIFFNQKTFYKNDTIKNGQTVFWDTGFIILKDEKIVLHSAQVGGRLEMYELTNEDGASYTFDSRSIFDDLKTIRSQRIFRIVDDRLFYELNMATHGATAFQNHLSAQLKKFNILS